MKAMRTLLAGVLTLTAVQPLFATDPWRSETAMRPSGGAGPARMGEVALPGTTGRPAPSESDMLASITSRTPVLGALTSGGVQVTASAGGGIELFIQPPGVRQIAMSADGDAAAVILGGLTDDRGRTLSSRPADERVGTGSATIGDLRSALQAAQRGEGNIFIRLDVRMTGAGPQVTGAAVVRAGGTAPAPGGTVPAPAGGGGPAGGGTPVVTAVVTPALAPGSPAAAGLAIALPADRLDDIRRTSASGFGYELGNGLSASAAGRPNHFIVTVTPVAFSYPDRREQAIALVRHLAGPHAADVLTRADAGTDRSIRFCVNLTVRGAPTLAPLSTTDPRMLVVQSGSGPGARTHFAITPPGR